MTPVAGEADEGLEFAKFFDEEYRGLVRALYLLTADEREAEELAQETMARIYERWNRVRRMESPGGYAYRMAVNLNRQRLRHLGVRARRLLALAARREPEQPVGARLEISEAVASLNRGHREAFMLVDWLGMTTDEAAALLGLAPASVRTRIHRARLILRERLGEGNADE